MSNPNRDPLLINSIENKVCKLCTTGVHNICLINPISNTDTANTESECKSNCARFNSESYYFYDKNGTKRCYCGKTKISCDAVSQLCDGSQTEMCWLKQQTVIDRNTVSNDVSISTNVCNEECKKILQSDGLLLKCNGINKCVCIDPSVIPSGPTGSPAPVQCATNNLTCPDGTPIQNNTNYPDNGYSTFLGNQTFQTVDPINTALCDCDNDILTAYTNAFKDEKKTLSSIWNEAVSNSKNNKDKKALYDKYNCILNQYTGGDIDKLKILTAYEMCKRTNERYSRIKPATQGPPIGDDPGGWLQNQLKNSKTLNYMVYGVIIYMIMHLLKKFFFPADVQNSLIYALFFMNTDGSIDDTIMLSVRLSIFMMLFIIGASYTLDKTSPGELGIFITSVIIIFCFFIGYSYDIFNQGDKFYYFFIISVVSFTIGFTLRVIEKENNPDTDVSIRKKWIMGIICGFMILVIIFGGYRFRWSDKYEKFGTLVIFATLILMMVINMLPDTKNNDGQDFIHYFVPSSLMGIFTSGFAISIYSIILGSLVLKMNFSHGKNAIMFLALCALGTSLIGWYLDTNPSAEPDGAYQGISASQNPYMWTYFGVTLSITLFYLFLFFFFRDNTDYNHVVPMILITIFGYLPLVAFAIIINIAITIYSPSIELLLLILWRVSGMLLPGDPTSGIGNILLMMSGKRNGDGWVLPFLPLVSHMIKISKLVSGEDMPGYFSAPVTSKGVSNREMWFS